MSVKTTTTGYHAIANSQSAIVERTRTGAEDIRDQACCAPQIELSDAAARGARA
jgi:hypothetical protein